MKNQKKHSGFTLIELMISITIVAMVLAAASMAFDACIQNYQVGRDISDAVIKANQTLTRITADLRCAQAVEPNEPNSQCSMFTAAGDDITYRFSAGDQTIYYDDNTASLSYKLCEGISSAFFEKTTDFNDMAVEYVKSVQISLSVGSGDYTQNACAAVAIRKNLTQ